MASLKRRVFALASVGGIAALLLTTLGVSTAAAHGIVTSGDMQNQTIRSVDISAGGVGQSEIRENGVDQSEIENQSIQSWNIGAQEVGTSDLRDGSVREEDLSQEVLDQLGAPSADADNSKLDETEPLPPTRRSRSPGRPCPAHPWLFGHVTASGEGAENNVVCSLISGGTPLAEANEKLGTEAGTQQNASLTLFGLAPSAGDGILSCHAGNGGTATDISMASVRVSTG